MGQSMSKLHLGFVVTKDPCSTPLMLAVGPATKKIPLYIWPKCTPRDKLQKQAASPSDAAVLPGLHP